MLVPRRSFLVAPSSAGHARWALLGTHSSAGCSWSAFLGRSPWAGSAGRRSSVGSSRHAFLGGIFSGRFARRAVLGVLSSAGSALGGLERVCCSPLSFSSHWFRISFMLTVNNLRILFILTLLSCSTLCFFLGGPLSAGSSRRAFLGGLFSAGCSQRRSSAGVPQWVLFGWRFSACCSWRAFLGGLFLAYVPRWALPLVVYREFVVLPFCSHRTCHESALRSRDGRV